MEWNSCGSLRDITTELRNGYLNIEPAIHDDIVPYTFHWSVVFSQFEIVSRCNKGSVVVDFLR